MSIPCPDTRVPGALRYRGRFAPSPSGPLHFGSLVTAVASYLEARSRQGEWLVRIENPDPPREIPGASRDILHTLETLHLFWDEEVIYQHDRNPVYAALTEQLIRQRLVYPCTCTRKEIADSSIRGIDGHVYPGTCRHGLNLPDGRSLYDATRKPYALRVRVNTIPTGFTDTLQGPVYQQLEKDIGDFVLQRADQVYTYQLAAVADDAAQQITHVVRGADLLASTPRQIYLQQLLGYPTPVYMHVPVAVNSQGEKLSKQTGALPADLSDPVPVLVQVLHFLGQTPPAALLDSDIVSFWDWAIRHWQPANIPRQLSLPVTTSTCLQTGDPDSSG